jgi:branched-chain amino acid aminotransferase
MAKQASGYVWLDGKFVNWGDAKVHLLTHSLQYGSGVFEGIRCYNTKKGPAIFRLREHMCRFMQSMKIYGMVPKFTQRQLEEAALSTISKNNLPDAYIRPFAFYPDAGIGFNVRGKSTSIAMMALRFVSLFAGHNKGIRCKTSTWLRINSSAIPAAAKASGNYINSILASKEANDSGYDEAILMAESGLVAEGPGENIFIVQDNILITPPKSANILLGITRDSILRLAKAEGIKAVERDIRKEELYTSDEVFFAGTAAEITPIISVDSRIVGDGVPGRLATSLASKYSRAVRGEDRRFTAWLSYIKS